ncbi:aldehyde dehydrogenase [Streptomyces sp. NPDC059479]|uniref:aldehyde dehydrogenase n=1 Tax=Streptomyces sp. NPDC059479 TaxID=3346848 RepID=UPI0036C8595D
MEHDRLFMGGGWAVPHSTARIPVTSPRSEQPIGSAPEADAEDVDTAVSAARAAFDAPEGWAHWEPARRAEALNGFADALEARSSRIARQVTAQNGMPVTISESVEGRAPAFLLRHAAELSTRAPLERVQERADGTGSTLIRQEPVGVVGAIAPWNFPQSLAAFKYAFALAAGCTVVLKPSPETVLDSVLLADAAMEAGLPAGVMNIVFGGTEAGSALVAHRDVDKIGFTGSTAVGRVIAESCARLLRPVTLELGGKSAAVLLDDVDVEAVVHSPAFSAMTMFSSGQTCWASTRILAPRSRYEESVEALASMMDGLVVGDPFDPRTQIGPMVSEKHRTRVESYIRKGVEEGARLVTGGGRPRHMDTGWYVEPTLFADVDNGSAIAQEEIFGPVLCVIPYEDDAGAVRLADDSSYGLSGSVWTGDTDRGIALARRVRTGVFSVNGKRTDLGAPFGGEKNSGLGRELGAEGLASYRRLQSIYV